MKESSDQYVGSGSRIALEQEQLRASALVNTVAPARPRLLICTVGLPLAGKTTWARRQGYPIVCPDEIRRALHGERFITQAEPMVWAIATIMVRSLFGAGHERVILDACNNTRERRDQWSREFETRFKVIETSAEDCLRRALDSADEYAIPIIGRMASEQEPINGAEENLWHA